MGSKKKAPRRVKKIQAVSIGPDFEPTLETLQYDVEFLTSEIKDLKMSRATVKHIESLTKSINVVAERLRVLLARQL